LCQQNIIFIFVANIPGKIQTLANATREQRREYKAKFVDMDVEFGRLKERMETLNMILDDMQVSSKYFMSN
jgi:hypothetical protein